MEHALDLAAWVRWHAAARSRVRTHVSLQKLCFYGYGTAAALDVEETLGAIRFEAWKHGPACRAIYEAYVRHGADPLPSFDGPPPRYPQPLCDALTDALDVLDEVLEWVRSLPGSSGLRALICFDEVYGFLPPHPQNPPTKRPIVSLMKQARAFGVGVVVATQNPMDLDYRALSNAGMWWIGRLSTDADRERVLDGMALDRKLERSLAKVVGRLLPRWFIERDVHADRSGPLLLQPRWAMSLLRGPMTRVELAMARNLVW